MNRLEETRRYIDQILLDMTDVQERRCAYIHLHGVSQVAALLALRRGLNPELAAISGMLHDIYAYGTGLTELHDQNGAEEIRPVIRDMGILDADEQVTVVSAVFHHGDKGNVHQPCDEVLKDADVLQHYLYNTGLPVDPKRAARVEAVLRELGLPSDFEVANNSKASEPYAAREDKRARLGDIAEGLASAGICGLPEDRRFRALCRYWPGEGIPTELKDSWCAAFVYHCCMEAGFVLPIRHPLVSCRFAAVRGWLEWARLPETGFFHGPNEKSFSPDRGDLVIYDELLQDRVHDHIGVVLSREGEDITVAEGNGDANRSGIVRRSCREKIAGFVRMENEWRYQSEGRAYNPQALTGKQETSSPQ